MAKPRLKLVTPATVNRTVPPARRPNADLRTREHLTEAEVERLIAAAKGNRYGHRDATMVLLAYRHGLRAAELVDLRWDQIDFSAPPQKETISCCAANGSDGPRADVASQIFSVRVDAEPNEALDRHRLNAPNGLGR